MKKLIIFFGIIFAMAIITTSCQDDFLDRTTQTNISDVKVVSTLEGLDAILHGCNRKMYSNYKSSPGFTGLAGLAWGYDSRCEDIAIRRTSWIRMDQKLWYAGEKWSSTSTIYSFYYNLILNCNVILKEVGNFIESEHRNSVEGQAKSIRAMCYFNLARLYQFSYKGHEDAPGLCLVTEVTKEGQPRTSLKEAYDLILSDLNSAATLLKEVKQPHKSMMSVHTTNGLLARVYQEMTNWEQASKYAKLARVKFPLMSRAEYTKGFNSVNNSEWIWGSQVISDQVEEWITLYDLISIEVPGESYGVYYNMFSGMLKELYEQIPENDVRRDNFSPTYSRFPYVQRKFKQLPSHMGDYVHMRSSEMLLIEAEAAANLGSDPLAKTLLKELRDARTLEPSDLSGNSGQALLDEIYLERRIELWGEGFRFFDLKRLNQKMSRVGYPQWENKNLGLVPGMLYINVGEPMWNMQIPLKEMEINKALSPSDQNPAPRL